MRYAVYARYSSVGQNPLSVQQQVAACREWAGRQPVRWEECREPAIDAGISAYSQTATRAGLDSLTEWIGAGALDGGCILVWSTSRLSRQFGWVIPELIRLHDQHGISLADTEYGVYDLATTQGRLMLTLRASMDQEYSETLGRAVARGKRDQARRGYWPYSHRPYGTTTRQTDAGHVLIRDPQTAPVLDDIYKLRQDNTFRAICGELVRRGIPSYRGNKHWSTRAILNIITNPTYLGKVPYKGELHDSLGGPIVDPDLWLAVQTARAQVPRSGPARRPLGGLMTCAHCGAQCWPVPPRYYVCRTRIEKCNCGAPGWAREDLLIEGIWTYIEGRLAGPAAGLWARLTATQSAAGEAEAVADLQRAQAAEGRLAQALAVAHDSAPLLAQIEAAATRRREIEAKLADIREAKLAAAVPAKGQLRALRESKPLSTLVASIKLLPRDEGHAVVRFRDPKAFPDITLRVRP